MRERKQKPMLMWSALTDSCYVVLRYKHLGGNDYEAQEKYDVTQDFLRLVQQFNQKYAVKSRPLETTPQMTQKPPGTDERPMVRR